jgi:hypothetical protein
MSHVVSNHHHHQYVRSQSRKFKNLATIDPLSGKSKGKERKEKGRKEPVLKKFLLSLFKLKGT